VLVLGSGTIGLLSVMAARAAGAAEVVATYRHEHQGQAALSAGATKVAKDDQIPELKPNAFRAPPAKPFDVVIETIGGSAPTLGQALGAVRPGGRVSVLGLFTQGVAVNALALMLKEVKVVGGITYCRPGQQSDFDAAIGILQRDPERARAIITHRFALSEAAEAFATAADKGSGSIKVQVAT